MDAPSAAVTLADVLEAGRRVAGRIRETPMLPNSALADQVGAPVLLKCENLQRSGSFKLRGAMNVLGTVAPVSGVVAASAGNHGQAVALAASEHGVLATIVMPRDAPLVKQLATRGYGAQVELVDGPLAAAIDRARAIASEREEPFIPPFDHPAVVAGQGTLGLEIVEQVADVETVVVPAGGGGLLAGVALAVKSLRPSVRVIGVQTAAMPGIVASLSAGSPMAALPARTVADGVAVAGPSPLTFGLIRQYVDDVVTVTEESIALAIVMLIERARVVVEGAGALGVAALLSDKIASHGRTVVVLSGGNIDINTIGRMVERGLLHQGRHRTLTVAVANIPGELARVVSTLGARSANILEVTHELVTSDLPVGVTRLTLRVEVADADAFAALVAALVEAGLVRGAVTDLMTPAAAAMPW